MKAVELLNKINSKKDANCEWTSRESNLSLTAFSCEKALVMEDPIYKLARLDIVNYGHSTSLFGEDVFDFLICWLNFEKKRYPEESVEELRPYKLLSKLKIKIEFQE